MKVLLVDSNRMKPPVAPIGLDYLADSLVAAGHDARLLDLCLSADDERFFLPAGGEAERDYNYNDNELLSQAIASGERGAYWDILRRTRRKAG